MVAVPVAAAVRPTAARVPAALAASCSPMLGRSRSLAGVASRAGSAATTPSRPPPAAQAYQFEPAAGGAPEAVIGEVEFDPFLANSLSVIGNLGSKPEIKYLENGNKVATMSLAMRGRKDAETEWMDVEAWGPLAERAAAEVDRGDQIAVQGRLRINAWTDSAGTKRKTIRITANTINKVRPPSGNGRYDARSAPQQQQQMAPPAPEYASAGGAAAAAAPVGSTTEEMWMSFFEDPSGWFDNRPSKASGATNPKAPDFKRKEGGREAPALWIDSRTTPTWVTHELQKMERMAQAPPPF